MIPIVQEGVLGLVQRQDACVAQVDLWGKLAAGQVALRAQDSSIPGRTAGVAVAPAAAVELNHPSASQQHASSTLHKGLQV